MSIIKGKKSYVVKELKKLIMQLRAYENDSDVEIDEYLNVYTTGDIKNGYMLDSFGKPKKKKRAPTRKRSSKYEPE